MLINGTTVVPGTHPFSFIRGVWGVPNINASVLEMKKTIMKIIISVLEMIINLLSKDNNKKILLPYRGGRRIL